MLHLVSADRLNSNLSWELSRPSINTTGRHHYKVLCVCVCVCVSVCVCVCSPLNEICRLLSSSRWLHVCNESHTWKYCEQGAVGLSHCGENNNDLTVCSLDTNGSKHTHVAQNGRYSPLWYKLWMFYTLTRVNTTFFISLCWLFLNLVLFSSIQMCLHSFLCVLTIRATIRSAASRPHQGNKTYRES